MARHGLVTGLNKVYVSVMRLGKRPGLACAFHRARQGMACAFHRAWLGKSRHDMACHGTRQETCGSTDEISKLLW